MKTKKNAEIYQFKISLDGSKPPIWRRIHVPSTYSFFDLHIAIQDSMGWEGYHLHMFEMEDPRTGAKVELGMPDQEYQIYEREVLADHKEKISKYFSDTNQKARYEYDFGDSWIHTVKLEKILPAKPGEKYPKCIAGKMACPPEDCGGIPGYYYTLSILEDPEHEEYSETIDWLGKEFNPKLFDPDDVFFDDPKERFKELGEEF